MVSNPNSSRTYATPPSRTTRMNFGNSYSSQAIYFLFEITIVFAWQLLPRLSAY